MKNLFAILLLSSISLAGISQTRLAGTVYGGGNEPVTGANVFIKGTSIGGVSDVNGHFTINTNEKSGILVVSFIGYETIEESFHSSREFTIQLKASKTSLDDVMVIGYGSLKKKDLTGAISSVPNVEQITSRPVSSVQDFFLGSVAGVTVQQQGGDPANQASITVRGVGSVNAESPLWVVDGMPYYGGTLNPNDIESITILKDAASAAIYGAQASSGVIVVTTKSGKAGKMSVSVDASAGFQQGANLPTPLNAEQQNWAYNTAADNSGADRNPARDPELNPWGAVTRTNWIDAIFRNAAFYNANVRLSGGMEKGTYSTSFNYYKKDGLLLSTSSERFALRLKSDYHLMKNLLIGQNFYVTREEAIGTNTSSSYSGAIINAIYMPSAAPVYDEEGNFHGVAPEGSEFAGAYGDVYNPVALLLRPTTSNPATNIDANFYGEYTILNGLKFRSSFSLGQRHNEYKKFDPKRPENGRPSEMNYLTQSWSKRNKWIWDNQVTYSKTVGEHRIELTAVHSAQHTKYEYNSVNAQDFAREEKWYQYLENAGEITSYGSDAYEDALVSIIGRAMYSYKDKYYLTGSIRRDQTSRLAHDNNSDVFPSVSAAWRISEEPFLSHLEWLYSLKLRASWGEIGNIQSVGYYAYNVPMASQRPTMGEGDAQQVPGYYVSQQSNPDLKWETSESYNVGLDLLLLNGNLEITSDYFRKYTHDMIMTNDADSHLGVSEGPTANVGTVKNTGFEIAAGYHGSSGDFTYSVNLNFSHIKNELDDLDGYTSDYIYHSGGDYNVRSNLYPYRSEPGEELYSYYLITCLGTFKSESEIQSHVNSKGELLQPNAQPGDLKFEDTNQDGTINNDDRTFRGNAFPDFSYGINLSATYRNFDLSMFFQGVSKSKLFNGYKYTTYNASQQGYNLDNRVLGAWSESNPNSNIPLLRVDDPNSNFSTISDWYLEDGSYLRLKNLTVGYTLSNDFMNKISSGSSFRVYLSCENLFTITDYSGMDPEIGGVGLDVGTYPVARTYSAGISLNF